MEFAADNLPDGLELDSKQGILTGVNPPRGEYVVTLRAENELGKAEKKFKLVSGTVDEMAGVAFRGHTEYLEQFYPDAIMTFWSEKLIVALLSHHLPLKTALEKIDKDGLVRFVSVLRASVEKARPGAYRFLMAGLNPHAGENGLLGSEETDVIGPAVEATRAAGADISGPHAPDVVFRLAYGRPRRIVIALYHDQGLIPFKLEAFDTGVNVTLGLPFIRSSPDHGTAFDIAGKHLANPQSMFEAIRLAAELSLGVF